MVSEACWNLNHVVINMEDAETVDMHRTRPFLTFSHPEISVSFFEYVFHVYVYMTLFLFANDNIVFSVIVENLVSFIATEL